MKILSKIFKGVLLTIVILVIVFFLGPKVDPPNMDTALPKVNADLVQLEKWIDDKEVALPNVKPNNQSRIVWFDSIPTKTDYSIVYLHGWSASSGEGDPIHTETAKKYGCNLYLPRLAGHGLNEKEAMLNLTANEVLDSAKEAIAIAKQLGNKVIIMATSTGGTLALHLAGGDSDIAGILLYSPNVEIYDKNAKLLTGPWGLQLAKAVKKSDYHEFEASDEKKKYWTTKYRVEALTHLQALVDNTMVPETFQKVEQPVFLGYFYKDEANQDNVVSVPAMLKMFEALGTESNLKRKVAFSNVGDHVMTSSITSKDLESVQEETDKFFEEIIGLQSVSKRMLATSQE
ncbi:alpha/beta hydrolase [Flagellimonas hymeniacidonis]|uniref:Alpha/beta hydrolase n=2 Tax=Flagellimonas hymeniacidonis TaxID=2603628 RepID=A0A5C8V6U4_9FLAO|nr:alpha/beta hydrolase [Flagellimonas hymeniacidonis]